jgi:hypothetical protein
MRMDTARMRLCLGALLRHINEQTSRVSLYVSGEPGIVPGSLHKEFSVCTAQSEVIVPKQRGIRQKLLQLPYMNAQDGLRVT